jgi:hypothetical protein
MAPCFRVLRANTRHPDNLNVRKIDVHILWSRRAHCTPNLHRSPSTSAIGVQLHLLVRFGEGSLVCESFIEELPASGLHIVKFLSRERSPSQGRIGPFEQSCEVSERSLPVERHPAKELQLVFLEVPRLFFIGREVFLER